jgi:hypothetical protein
MLNRQELIYELTKYELEWFSQNDDDQHLRELADFFAKGGFFGWDDKSLQKKYELFIAEEQNA